MVLIAILAIMAALVVETRRSFTRLPHTIEAITLPRERRIVIAAYSDGSVQARELTTGATAGGLEPTHLLNADAPVIVSSDGRRVARILWWNPLPPGTVSLALQIYDLTAGQEILRRPVSSIGATVFSSDGNQFAIDNFQNNELRVIDVGQLSATDDIVLSPLDISGAPATASPWSCSMLFSPGGHELFRLNVAGELSKWNLQTGEVIRTQIGGPAHWLLAQSPDGERLAVDRVGLERNLSDAEVELFAGGDFAPLAGPVKTKRVFGLAFIDRGQTLAVLVADSGLEFWDAQTLRFQRRIEVPPNTWHLAARDSQQEPIIAVADEQRVYLLDGNRWRQVSGPDVSWPRQLGLWIALCLVVLTGIVLRRRRIMRTRVGNASFDATSIKS